MSSTIEPRTKGFTNAESYEIYRPSYPLSAVSSLLQKLGIEGVKGARLVDLAAGTGKFTELLASREEQYEITAVEPSNSMRGELQRKSLRGVKVVQGEASKMNIESHTIDAVVVAQAFHWFANKESLKEIHRILVPGGQLGLIWNVEDYCAPKSWVPNTEWEGKLKSIVWSSGNELPRLRHQEWKQVFEQQLVNTPLTTHSADPLFSLPLGEEVTKWTHWSTQNTIWERIHTISQFAILEGEELESIKRQVFEALACSSVKMNENREVALHGQTLSAWTSAIPSTSLKYG